MLLASKSTSISRVCFDTIISILDGRFSNGNGGECIQLMRIAISHDCSLQSSFEKYLSGRFKSSEVTPFTIVLALVCLPISSVFGNTSTSTSSIQTFIDKQIKRNTARVRVAKLTGRQPASIINILSLLQGSALKRIAVDDEPSIVAVFTLAQSLLAPKRGRSATPFDNILGQTLFREAYQRFIYARSTIVATVVDELLCDGPNAKQFSNVLNDLYSIDKSIVLNFLSNQSLIDEFFEYCCTFKVCTDICSELCTSLKWPQKYFYITEYPQFIISAQPESMDPITCSIILNRKDHRWISQLLESHFSQLSSNTFLIMYLILDDIVCLNDGECIDWPKIVLSCLSENLAQQDTTEDSFSTLMIPIHHLLDLLSRLIDHGDHNEDHEKKLGLILDHLVEVLCCDIAWFDGFPEFISYKMSAALCIYGLFEVAVMHCCKQGNRLSDRARFEAVTKLLMKLDAFCSTVTIQQAEIIPILDEKTVLQLISSLNCTPSLLHWLLSVGKWKRSDDHVTNQLHYHLLSAIGSLCESLNSETNQVKALLHQILERCRIINTPSDHDSKISFCNGEIPSVDQAVSQALKSVVIGIIWMIKNKSSSKDICTALEFAKILQGRLLASCLLSDGLLEDWKMMCQLASGTSVPENTISKGICLLTLNSSHTEGPKIAHQLSLHFLTFLGHLNPEEDEDVVQGQQSSSSIPFNIVNSLTVESILQITINYLSDRINDSILLIEEAKRDGLLAQSLFETVSADLKVIGQCAIIISKTALPGGINTANRLVAFLCNLYKCLMTICSTAHDHAVSQFAICVDGASHRGFAIRSILSPLMDIMVNQLTPVIYDVLPRIQKVEMDIIRITEEEAVASGSKKKNIAKNSIYRPGKITSYLAKERQCIPSLIFSMEAFEQALLKLNSLATKLNNGTNEPMISPPLITHIHRSTARDFRIEQERLEKLQALSSSSKEFTDQSEHETNPSSEDESNCNDTEINPISTEMTNTIQMSSGLA